MKAVLISFCTQHQNNKQRPVMDKQHQPFVCMHVCVCVSVCMCPLF